MPKVSGPLNIWGWAEALIRAFNPEEDAFDTNLSGALAGEDLDQNRMLVEQRFEGVQVTADVQLVAGPGFLHSLTFACTDAAPTAGSIIIYDSLTETGTVLYSETFTTTPFRGYTVTLDIPFSLGLYVGFTTTNDVGVTPSFREDV